MIRGILVAVGATIVLCSGCMAPVGSKLEVPEDAAQTCQNHCHSIGMELSAVAIMASNVGCICQFRGAPQAAAANASKNDAVTAGMATIMLQEEEEQRRQQQQQQQQQQAQPIMY